MNVDIWDFMISIELARYNGNLSTIALCKLCQASKVRERFERGLKSENIIDEFIALRFSIDLFKLSKFFAEDLEKTISELEQNERLKLKKTI